MNNGGIDQSRSSSRRARDEAWRKPTVRAPKPLDRRDSLTPAQQTIKRGVDLLGSTIAIALLWPLLVTIAFIVVVTMGRPILFAQPRIGLNGSEFMIYKFRTMRNPRPGENPFTTDSVRVTRFGKILRSTSLDELPELFLVAAGQMSLVGPRPLLPNYLPLYSAEQGRRHSVKPGLTGWAAVNGRQKVRFGDRLAMDVWYVDNYSLRLDCRIIASTLAQVVRSHGVDTGQRLEDVDDLGLAAAVEIAS